MKALIVVDMQNDFIDGSLAVPRAKEIIDPINKLMKEGNYDLIVASQDWHPEGHISFASRYSVKPFTEHNEQIVWPDHCVIGTKGAEISKDINSEYFNMIIKKGFNKNIDSYSALMDSSGKISGLHEILSPYCDIHVCGLASDYCVYHTILSGVKLLPDNNFYFLDFASRFVDDNNREIVGRTFDSFFVKTIKSPRGENG